MFTGIVEEIGAVRTISRGNLSAKMTIEGNLIFEDLKVGDSVAVNGVCITAAAVDSNRFTADVMHETINRSSLSGLKPGTPVNLERAMAANGRFGGHIVSGHIDGTGILSKIERDDNAILYTIKAGEDLMRYIVPKGSIAVDGISLTVAYVQPTGFTISVIPHTVKVTVLSQRKQGDRVNLENDIIGKYVDKLLKLKDSRSSNSLTHSRNQPKNNITEEFLSQNGFI